MEPGLRNKLISLLLLVFVVSQTAGCGGGGGSGSSASATGSDSVADGSGDTGSGDTTGDGTDGGTDSGGDTTRDYSLFFPDDGAIYQTGGAPELWVNNSQSDERTGVYVFYLATEEDGATVEVAQSEEVAQGEDGYGRWTPSDVTLEKNREYWWRWRATYTYPDPVDSTAESEVRVMESDTYTLRVIPSGGFPYTSPRTLGYMDSNLMANPTLAVYNIYTAGGALVTYDFEFFTDPALTAPLLGAENVAMNSVESFTSWTISQDLLFANGQLGEDGVSGGLMPDTTYFWQARINIDGYSSDWFGPFSFTTSNICQVGRRGYGGYITEWTRVRVCDDLLRTDPTEALGPTNADGFISQDEPGYGFVSMDNGATLGIEMDRAIADRTGYDIRVYEYWSQELLELFAGRSEIGPWQSLGVAFCGDYCDFDLGVTEYGYAKYFKILSLASPTDECYQTAGPDIDSLEGLSLASSSDTCLQ